MNANELDTFELEPDEWERRRLLGLTQDGSAATGCSAGSHHWRNQLLEKQQSYLQDKRQEETSTRKGKVLSRRLPVAVASFVLLIALGFGGLTFANARQTHVQQQYALNLLKHAFDLYCEDLELVNEGIALAQQELPEQPTWQLAQSDWQRLVAFNNSARALHSAKGGHTALGQAYLDRVDLEELSGVGSAEVELLLACAHAKASFETLRNYGARGTLRFEQMQGLFQNAKSALDDAKLQLDSARFSSLQQELLVCALEIDHARFRLKTAGYHDGSEMQSEKYAEIKEMLAEADSNLELVPPEERNIPWWILKLRLAGNKLLHEQRLLISGLPNIDLSVLARAPNPFGESVDPLLVSDDRYAASLAYEYGVYLGNRGDLLLEAREEYGVDRSELEMDFREQAIEVLDRIPLHSRTTRFRENLVLNYCRLLMCQVDSFVANEELEERWPELIKVSVSIQTLTGTSLMHPVGQDRGLARAIAATILGTPESEVDFFMDRFNGKIAGSLSEANRARVYQLRAAMADEASLDN